MCGFCGWVGNKKVEDRNSVLYKMTDTITTRGPNETGYYQDDYINLGHNRLIVIDPNGGKQPMEKMCNGQKFVIAYNGEIYNIRQIRRELESNGIHIETNSDTEIVLGSYILWKEKCVEHLVGIFSFAIWEKENMRVFLARDHFGIKPLFYSFSNNNLVFASEIKSILKYPNIDAVLDKEGICQLFGLGPARVPGKCVFKNIYEIKPASYAIFDFMQNTFSQVRYWELKSYEHIDDELTTIDTVRKKLDNAIKEQLVSDVPLGSMLSGGVDSSLITAIAQLEFEKEGKTLKTFSVDYVDNDKNFKANDFQPDSDKAYIQKMQQRYDVEHHDIVLNSERLVEGLHDAMQARDLPGMADVDVSLLEFCKEIKKEVSVVLSGEYADEVFGGYPWFYREDSLNSDTFPWSVAIDTRQRILNKKYKDIDLKKYVNDVYDEFVEQVPLCKNDSEQDKKIKKLMYLNMYWFGATLIDRTDRMSMRTGLEVRVPFTDYRLVQYVWNIPWDLKTMLGREKGLLRLAYKDVLPKEIAFRKKSPYPKTYDPKYTQKLKEQLMKILNNDKEPIHKLIDKEEVKNILNDLDNVFTRPWFGQLMTGPQFIAYLIQLNMWLVEYDIQVEE